jgi:creatinine amidohydrolase
VRLSLSTWPEVEAYLERSKAIILPIGSTEQHGPTGLIGTDAMIAEEIAVRCGAKLGLLVAPTIGIGMAQHHLAFPGSLTLRPETLMAVLGDVFASLSLHGFEQILVMNGHGGNTVPITMAANAFCAERSLAGIGEAPLIDALDWWTLPGVIAYSDRHFGDRDGLHATVAEIAITWAMHPDKADPRILSPQVAPGFVGIGTAEQYRRSYPDGRIGSDPSLASPAHGAALLDTIAAEGCRWIQQRMNCCDDT